MTVTVEIEGVSQLSAYLKKYGRDAEAGIGKEVTKTALEINADVKKRIQRGPKSGVTYHRIAGEDGLMRVYAGSFSEYGPNKLVAAFKSDGKANLSPTHQSSAPGEAPATDTGTLASSIYFTKSGKLGATIGSRLAYAYYLEYGTKKISPRPSWTPAAELGQKALNKRVEDVLRKAAQ